MKVFSRFMKGEIPATTSIPVATTWTEFQPDEDDGSEDGSDQIHHARMEHLIDYNAKMAHLAESLNEDRKDG